MLMPDYSRRSYAALIEAQRDFEQEAANSPFNRYEDGPDKQIGFIACGIAYNYLMENFPEGCPHPVLKIAQYPLPRDLVARLLDDVEQVMVMEDGMPLVEERLRGFPTESERIRGRLDGTLPRTGELDPTHVARALGREVPEPALDANALIANRPPQLCQGCPHGDTFRALNEALDPHGDGHVFADIGCYTLGVMPPYNAINTCLDMGASVTMAKGAADAGLRPAVAVIGDSTFSHSGMTGLLDVVNAGLPVKVLILDNATTAMTGGQDAAAQGHLEDIALGLGVPEAHVRVITPLPRQHEQNVAVINEELDYDGVSVIIARRECIETAKRKRKSARAKA
jgi:indolepyruvate ferredoxin oxidoreductase alpha subunit